MKFIEIISIVSINLFSVPIRFAERDRKDQEYSSKVSENNESSCEGTKPIDRDYYMDEKLLGAITKTKTTGEFPNVNTNNNY